MIIRAPQVRLTLLAAADLAVLGKLAPNWAALGRHLSNPGPWVAQAGADRAVADLAGAALWGCALWLALGLVIMVLAVLPDRLGEFARQTAGWLVPATMLRLVGGFTGLSMGLAVMTPVAFGPPVPFVASMATNAANVANAGSAALAPPVAPVLNRTPIDVSAPSWPIGPGSSSSPGAGGAPAIPGGPEVASPPPTATSYHVVVAGDCLWDLAASQLGVASPQQISAQMRLWYATNRTAIGPDPALVRPGQRLIEPAVTR